LIISLVFSFTAALPIIQVQAVERFERKRIEISIDPVTEGILYEANHLSDTMDMLDPHKVEGVEPVETIDLGRIPVTLKLNIRSGSIFERKSIEISIDPVTEPTGTDLDQKTHSQNFIKQLLDPLIGYKVREFKPVHSVPVREGKTAAGSALSEGVDLLDPTRDPAVVLPIPGPMVSFQVTISYGSILIDIVGPDPDPEPDPTSEPEPEEEPGPVAGP